MKADPMPRGFCLVLSLALVIAQCFALFQGPFVPPSDWNFELSAAADDSSWKASHRVSFIVSLKKRNLEQMHQHFLDVSNPKSSQYGRYLSRHEVAQLYGPDRATKAKIVDFFEAIPNSVCHIAANGDLLEVKASMEDIERGLGTKLELLSYSTDLMPQRAVRAISDLVIPGDIAEGINFISLNSPLNFLKARGSRIVRDRKATQATLSVTAGNEAALTSFIPTCSDGQVNVFNPPCPTDALAFDFIVTSYANVPSDPYPLDTAPFVFHVPSAKVYCYDTSTKEACSGVDGISCVCITQLSPLPKYTQLAINASQAFNSSAFSQPLGYSNLFVLTDVATPRFLSQLYSIPQGMRVNHGSNQSVAEFYGEFYSNPDLETFLSLAGLPNATIPTENVLGDLPNDQTNPGGEAQLDVEYIMAMAPGADTFFYSMNGTNPTDPVNTTEHNEDFLAYLLAIDDMPYPPLVHSLSYGDVEANIFNASNNGSIAYGMACDAKFMEYGLIGLTFLLSSGDQGIGGTTINDDVDKACSQAWPEWPTSSPYVTSVGATVLTDKYLPICGQNYALSSNPPESIGLPMQCTGTGETVCTGIFGGVITSGGGFSDVNNRSYFAPWQESVVDYYLRSANAANYPPLDYFNPNGRAYPDISTYGSNYFIYLDGKIQRESGTSASAPVFAAMVTLWNDIRLAYNQPPMGFIAPFLYDVFATHPEAFNDIVTGNNACGAGSSMSNVDCCTNSFSATPGWDAATGLGSPNFQIISNLVINNATAFPNLGAYPEGTASVEYVSSDDDSNEVEMQAFIALILASVSFALAIAALGLVLYRMSTEEKQQASNLNSALMSNYSDHTKA